MPIYLVRWPDLSAALVRAPDEEELVVILDQVGNADACEWWVYEGPLFMDFQLPVEWSLHEQRSEQPMGPEQIEIGDVGDLTDGDVVGALRVSLASGDDGYAMGEEIIRQAFPKLQAVIDRSVESADTEEPDLSLPEAELRTALHAELGRLVRSSWRRAHLRNKNDPASALAREMDLPLALAQRYADAALGPQPRDDGLGAPELDELDDLDEPDPLFVVSNHHTANSGRPPCVDADVPQAYHGYFANEYGEQAVYVYDSRTGEATVRMGDAGWDKVHRVVDGRIEGAQVSESEATWLRACWTATGANRGRRSPGGKA